jgi:hypothetical protein
MNTLRIKNSLKICGFLLVFWCLFSSLSWAYTAVLEWNPNSEPDLAGYIVYYGKGSRSYDNFVDVGNSTNCSVSGLESGVTYYFAVTAYDTDGLESSFSDETSYPDSNPQPPPDEGMSGGGSDGGCFIHASASDRSPINLAIIVILSIIIGFIASLHKVTSKPN